MSEIATVQSKVCYIANAENFSKIPGSPIAYWVSEKFVNIFIYAPLGKEAKPVTGMATTNNELFTRLWYEVNIHNESFGEHSTQEAASSGVKWFPYNKGGEFRKWFGNNDYVVNWKNDGEELKEYTKGASGGRMLGLEYFFKPCLTWSMITSNVTSFRYKTAGSILSNAGPSCYSDSKLWYLLGLLNSSVVTLILKTMNPTINTKVGDIAAIPVVQDNDFKCKIDEIVNKNISISKSDWDSYETSWDFKKHPLV